MNYYLFNRKELLQKANNSGGTEKAAEYYIRNKEVLKQNGKSKYRNLSEGDKEAKREYGRKRKRNMTEDKKNKLKEYLRYYQAPET